MTAIKSELYRDLTDQLAALLAGEADLIANAANTAALIYHALPDLNWAGFYFRKGAELCSVRSKASLPACGYR
jgi:GAF domain-containing protein